MRGYAPEPEPEPALGHPPLDAVVSVGQDAIAARTTEPRTTQRADASARAAIRARCGSTTYFGSAAL
jgi:hypothetical protein